MVQAQAEEIHLSAEKAIDAHGKPWNNRNMRLFPSAILCAVVFASQLSAGAATVTYTFEAPVFSLGETTPLTNKAPNIGSPSFLASFQSISGGANRFAIGNNPNLLSGMSLFDPGPSFPSGVLTISLNTPVDFVMLDFALFQPGRLDFASPSGNASASTGPSPQTGVLTFSSPTPFTAFTLFGYGGSLSTPFAIDNLVMNVPEPSALALISTGIFVGLFRRIRRRD